MNNSKPADSTPERIIASDREIHVWRIGLDESADDVARSRAVLSDDERRRADRFFAERHRAGFAIGRAALRTILGTYLAEAPERLDFRLNPHGKPMLDGLEFNLS